MLFYCLYCSEIDTELHYSEPEIKKGGGSKINNLGIDRNGPLSNR